MPRIVRLYPRMLLGGAEMHILQLLRGIPDSELVIPGVSGVAGELARPLTARLTVIDRPRLAPTVRALRGADIVHIHTINNHPLLGLAAQLAGPRRIVQTVHNNIESDYSLFADHTFVVGVETRDMLPVPGRVSTLTEGVDVPEQLPEKVPLAGRPVRILEVRREGKPMAFTLAQLIEAGALDGVDFEARVVGISGDSPHPRLQNLGEQSDPSPHYAWADILLHGTALETFGRTIYEAMAYGALPLGTPIPAFTERLVDGEQVLLAEGMRVTDGVALLRRALALVADAPHFEQMRHANFRWVTENASTEVMVRSQNAGYEAVLAGPSAPRSIVPADVPDAALDALGTILDALYHHEAIQPRAVDALPIRARALVFWALADRNQGPAKRRRQFYEAALQMLGPRPALLRALGVFHSERGERSESRAYYLKALQADPLVVTPYLELANSLIRENQKPVAREVLQALVRAIPDYTRGHDYLAALDGKQPARPRPFAHLRRFKRIIVTGPHRSGTTVATEMIAADTGLEALREESFDFYDESRLRELLQRDGIVVQCPALFDLMPALSDPHTAIVLMRRPLEELASSRSRMFDPTTAHQLSGDAQNEAQLQRLGQSDGDAAALKYSVWDRWRIEGRIHHPIELQYADLAKHPMWVSPEDRRKLGKRWHNRRTRL